MWRFNVPLCLEVLPTHHNKMSHHKIQNEAHMVSFVSLLHTPILHVQATTLSNPNGRACV